MDPSFELASLLLVAGLFILFLELFIPSAGILFVLATLCILGSILVAFMTSSTLGWSFLFGIVVTAPFLTWGGFELWKKSPIGRRMFLTTPVADENQTDQEVAFAAVTPNKEELLNKIGTTMTPLRPSGKTDFSGRRVDTVAEGVMIDRGKQVKVVRVEGNRVVVREYVPESNDLLDRLDPFEL